MQKASAHALKVFSIIVLIFLVLATWSAHRYTSAVGDPFDAGIELEIANKPLQAAAAYSSLLNKGDDLDLLGLDLMVRCLFVAEHYAECETRLDQLNKLLESNAAYSQAWETSPRADDQVTSSTEIARFDDLIALAGPPTCALLPNKNSRLGNADDAFQFLMQGLSAPHVARFFWLRANGFQDEAELARVNYLKRYNQALDQKRASMEQ